MSVVTAVEKTFFWRVLLTASGSGRLFCDKIPNHITEAVWKIEDLKQIEHAK